MMKTIIALTLLTSVTLGNIQVEPRNISVLFEKVGVVGTSLKLMEIRTELPLRNINDTMMKTFKLMEATTRHMMEINMPTAYIKSLHERTKEIKLKLQDLMQLSNFGTTFNGRNKRQAILGLGLAGGWMLNGLVHSLFSTDDHSRYDQEIINDLAEHEKKLRGIHKAIKLLAGNEDALNKKTNELNWEVKELEKIGTLSTVLSSFAGKLDQWIRGLHSAMTGRMTPDLLPVNEVQGILTQVRNRDHDGSISSIVSKEVGTFYNLPIQLERTAQGMDIIIRIPLYYPNHLYDLYHYKDLPVHIDEGVVGSFRSRKGDFLVADELNGIYKELKGDQLLDCANLDNIKLCPQLRLFERGINACLPALITGNLRLARKYCETMLYRLPNIYTEQITEDKLLVMNKDRQLVKASCYNPSRTTNHSMQVLDAGEWILTLPKNCDVGIGHYIMGRRPVTTRIQRHLIQYALLKTAEELKASMKTGPGEEQPEEDYKKSLATLHTLLETGEAVSLDRLELISKTIGSHKTYYWEYGLLSLNMFLIIIFLGFLARLMCRVRTRRRQQLSNPG
eukprot:TRINITY_DN1019_c0_g1_i1.p1 TRINITY_DN1019_c0_g1~~TRINITY_DN1019_c0_g1_i1.p1  ORF type:complete len:563 (+),score=-12.81 TRINITY_DN1019_c0_g1_i1:168-1856(+)